MSDCDYDFDFIIDEEQTPSEQVEIKNTIGNILKALKEVVNQITDLQMQIKTKPSEYRHDALQDFKDNLKALVADYFEQLYDWLEILKIKVDNFYGSDTFFKNNGADFAEWSTKIGESLKKLQYNSAEPGEEKYQKPIPARHLPGYNRRDREVHNTKLFHQQNKIQPDESRKKKERCIPRQRKNTELIKDYCVH